jgi:hypothetical protein
VIIIKKYRNIQTANSRIMLRRNDQPIAEIKNRCTCAMLVWFIYAFNHKFNWGIGIGELGLRIADCGLRIWGDGGLFPPIAERNNPPAF